MLNTTNFKLGSNTQNVQFNAPCTGILQKSNPKSTLVRFQKGSYMEAIVFPSNGDIPAIEVFERYSGKYKDEKGYEKYKETNGRIEITVLQVMIFGDNQYLCEVIENKFLNQETV